MNRPIKFISTYDDIAVEYYDSIKHPTCANFGELSELFLVARIKKWVPTIGNLLEVGAGRSIVAATLEAELRPLNNLTLLDQSPAMLKHSCKWRKKNVNFVVADACSTGLPAFGFQLIVSSLGDPYNYPSFWKEISRLLDRNGICLFTMPTTEWATRFRAGSDPTTAEFKLVTGASILVRSNIPSTKMQIDMINDAGLRIDEIVELLVSDIASPLSTKLLVSQNSSNLPVVRGFTIRAA